MAGGPCGEVGVSGGSVLRAVGISEVMACAVRSEVEGCQLKVTRRGGRAGVSSAPELSVSSRR